MPLLDLGNVIETADDNLVDEDEGEKSFRELERYLTEAKDIIVEQHEIKNYIFVKSVEKNFSGVRKFVDDIKRYRQRLTNPRTWRDHNENTIYLIKNNIT